MNRKQAIELLGDGHTIYKTKVARDVCKAVGVPYSIRLEQKWYSDKTGDPKGLRMGDGNEGMVGVYALELSRYVAVKLGVADKARDCLGRGFQAQAYAQVVEQKLRRTK